jgi:hypothetical protein
MADAITTGSVLVQEGTRLPKSVSLHCDSRWNGWAAVRGPLLAFEKTIEDEGWTFFFMAGEIKVTAFGSDREKALRLALKRLVKHVKAQRCNSIEITRVADKSFLRAPYVSVSAHTRHLQMGSDFSDPAPVNGTQIKSR